MKYRPEIDGLRAVAVLPVILFHAGFSTFGGGFIGVDVFFVISGYLITSIILNDLETGSFSFRKFYERRARRILPALFFVILCCIPFAWLWMMPKELKAFSASVVAVTAFVSNILFWWESGYFDTAARFKPLLHTWSLAVEEQFYIFFPIALLFLWRFGRRNLVAAIAAAAVISLGLSEWAARQAPEFNFFWLPTRAWELAAGSLCAFVVPRQSNLRDGMLSALGLAAILVSVFCYDDTTPFPSLYALLPVLGTCAIILFAHRETIAGAILSSPAFVGIGLISYSAYLWHQPLFAFARIRSATEPSWQLMLGLAGASLVLAYVSWRFIEAPARQKGRLGTPKLVMILASAAAVIAGTGATVYLNDGFRSRLPRNIAWESLGEKLDATANVCDMHAIAGFPGLRGCEFGDRSSSKTILLYGDSHAEAINQALDERFKRDGLKGVRLRLQDCEPIPTLVNTSREADIAKCLHAFETLQDYIKATASAVIVTARWTFRLYPVAGAIEQMPYRNGDGIVEKETYREYAVVNDGAFDFSGGAKRKAVEQFVDGLLSTGVEIILVYPIPEMAWDIARENWVHYRRTGSLLPSISIPYSEFRDRNAFVTSIFDGFRGRDNLVPVLPSDLFCNTFIKDRCAAQFDSIPLYYDDDHLSDIGAGYVVDAIMKSVPR